MPSKNTNKTTEAVTRAVTVTTTTTITTSTVNEPETKPKRALTDEQKAKMAAGRKAAAERRKTSSSPSEDPGIESDSDTPSKKASAIQVAQADVDNLEAEMKDLAKRLEDAKQRLAEAEAEPSSDEDDLPRLKVNGGLDMRYKDSKRIQRADGGLDLRFKVSKNALKKGIVDADGKLVSAE